MRFQRRFQQNRSPTSEEFYVDWRLGSGEIIRLQAPDYTWTLVTEDE
jgi:hypothetical protein